MKIAVFLLGFEDIEAVTPVDVRAAPASPLSLPPSAPMVAGHQRMTSPSSLTPAEDLKPADFVMSIFPAACPAPPTLAASKTVTSFAAAVHAKAAE